MHTITKSIAIFITAALALNAMGPRTRACRQASARRSGQCQRTGSRCVRRPHLSRPQQPRKNGEGLDRCDRRDIVHHSQRWTQERDDHRLRQSPVHRHEHGIHRAREADERSESVIQK